MSDGWGICAFIAMGFIVLFGIVSCSNETAVCKAAGGISQYEYKNLPSCWTKDGRRLFPLSNQGSEE